MNDLGGKTGHSLTTGELQGNRLEPKSALETAVTCQYLCNNDAITYQNRPGEKKSEKNENPITISGDIRRKQPK